jgi:two-component system sensor histidine kinase LytS
MELISGLSAMMSSQLEVAEADKAYQLAKEAEIKVLQAQISPHFLFNTLNTIVSLVRIDPAKARKLLVSLSHYLRQNMTATTQNMSTLEQELKHVKAYLEIEEARFVHKLQVFYEVDEEALFKKIPPLTLQPIVENAIKHGFKDKENNCVVTIIIKKLAEATLVKVVDNGQGMAEERTQQVIKTPIHSETGTGLALYNVNRRLSIMFGDAASIKIKSEPKNGTEVAFFIPYAEEANENGSH